ncbi:hypothetical protein HOK68_03920, partial [Candidatus Woesearchaeota archaeon]|nr:hypothetical protein [Candidatus Woesearchaeota archaeon]
MESKLSAPFSIYFLHGASCSGKSTLQTILIEDIANKLGSKLYKQFLELSNIKFTDRLRRKSEIEKKYIMQKNIVDDETFTRLNDSEEFFMTYSYNGKRYGFSSSALEEQINFSLQNPNSQFQYPIFFDNSSPNLPVITNKKLIDEINDKLSVHELDLKFDIKKILVFSSLDTTRTKFSYRFNESKGIEEYLIERADNDLEENLYFLNKLLKYTHFSCPFLFRDRAKMEEKQADDERLISCLDYSKKIEFLQAGYSRGNFDSMSIMESLNLITDKNEEKFSIIGLMEVLKEYFSPASLYKKHLIKSTKNSKHKNTIGKYSANLKIYYKKIAESFCKKIKKQYETLKKKKTLNPQKNVFFGKKKKKLENKIKEEKYDCLEKLINNYFDPEFDVNNINDNLKRIYNDFIINYATLDF